MFEFVVHIGQLQATYINLYLVFFNIWHILYSFIQLINFFFSSPFFLYPSSFCISLTFIKWKEVKPRPLRLHFMTTRSQFEDVYWLVGSSGLQGEVWGLFIMALIQASIGCYSPRPLIRNPNRMWGQWSVKWWLSITSRHNLPPSSMPPLGPKITYRYRLRVISHRHSALPTVHWKIQFAMRENYISQE